MSILVLKSAEVQIELKMEQRRQAARVASSHVPAKRAEEPQSGGRSLSPIDVPWSPSHHAVLRVLLVHFHVCLSACVGDFHISKLLIPQQQL